METALAGVNWLAVLAGTVVAFGLGMVWFGPLLFGKRWSAGSHNIVAPASPPLAAMAAQLGGTFLMALVIGVTAATDALILAIIVILAMAGLQLGSSLFGQKSGAAALIDAGLVVAMGVVMILMQGLL